MPTISVTHEEYDAIMFYRDETMDKAENASDEQYLADYDKHCKVFDNFRKNITMRKIEKKVKNS